MIKIYEIEENNFGYILTNSNKNEKLILYKTKLEGKKNSPYYLKQIRPIKTYLTGMFIDKKQKKFNGKTKEGNKIIITIKNNLAILEY
jgi:hypothetical protein